MVPESLLGLHLTALVGFQASLLSGLDSNTSKQRFPEAPIRTPLISSGETYSLELCPILLFTESFWAPEQLPHS